MSVFVSLLSLERPGRWAAREYDARLRLRLSGKAMRPEVANAAPLALRRRPAAPRIRRSPSIDERARPASRGRRLPPRFRRDLSHKSGRPWRARRQYVTPLCALGSVGLGISPS